MKIYNFKYVIYWLLFVVWLFLLCLFCTGCDESEDLRITESCRAYEDIIRRAVTKFNDLEGHEALYVPERIVSHTFSNRLRSDNDGVDHFYCDVPGRPGRLIGKTYYGYGDVYLWPSVIDEIDMIYLECTVLHELGHRVLALGHSEDRDTIMFANWTDHCLVKTRWK